MRRPRNPDPALAAPEEVDWVVSVTEPLPHCPSVADGWARLATQTDWATWRPESPMRGRGVTTTVVPPATEPLTTGDEYVVRVNPFLTIRCRVLESPSRAALEREHRHTLRALDASFGDPVR